MIIPNLAACCLCVHGRLHEEKQALEMQRLAKFCSAMKAVNGEIGPIYQKLTGGQGDVYLTFTQDALLLFAEGVHFHVRSVDQPWTSELSFGARASMESSFIMRPIIICEGVTVRCHGKTAHPAEIQFAGSTTSTSYVAWCIAT